jgi:hypothetical protein
MRTKIARSRNHRDYDGASLRDAALPHPVDLREWTEAGLIRIDLDRYILRVTDQGRDPAREA